VCIRESVEISCACALARRAVMCDRFSVGDVAMFFPAHLGTPEKLVYIAFNDHCLNRYLSDACVAEFKKRPKTSTVIGRIVAIQAATASAASNPYTLPLGTPFYVLTVVPVD
jgi:hypothetical protein